MDAVVLVGGFGTRLGPLTSDTPKQMLPVGHGTMLEAVVARLARHDVDRAVLSLGYRPEVFETAYPDSELCGVELVYAVDPEPLDTAGAIRFAAAAVGIDETFLALNGDVITTLDIHDQVASHRSTGAMGTIHLVPVDDPSRYGVVPTDDTGRVLGFVEKPPRETAPSRWINAGTYVLEPEALGYIPDGRAVSIERETFPAMVEDGVLFGYQADVYWIDAGTPESYRRVNLDLLDGQWADPIDAIAHDARVAASAHVHGSIIASGAEVSDDASVTESLVLPGARVGRHAIVEGSIIGARAVIGAGATIVGGSLIGPGAVVGDGDVHNGVTVPER
ncbi:MAG: NDP-sugar synthase [Acidimicrobiia bacterium]|nr:NDP-sugar synthase [Acidimicrobiia bacterium]